MNRQQTLHIPHSDYFTFLLYWVRQAEGEDQAHQLKHVETARIFWHHLDWVKLSTKFRVNKILRSSLIKPSVYIMFREISWTPLVLRAHLDKECGDHQCHERGDVVRQVVADDGHAALAVHLQVHLNTKCQEPRLKWDPHLVRISDAEDAAAAAHDVGDAAGVRHRECVGHGEGGVHPVVVGLGAAAGQLDKCVCISLI